mmetsp:Transcript_49029/g.96149  ORF Transcript_49029/g.96149 Transcript_49029/m.96149 type:complete len:425 (+) Transcript_49029:115-1389(+)
MSLDAKTTSPTTGRNVKSRFDYIKEPSIVENRPGPGNYETPKLFGKTGPAITISQTTAKIQEVIRPGPGPGEYKHKDYFGSGPTSRIGTGRKPEKLSPNPGPGAYEHKVFYGKDLKGGKMGTKKIEKVLATPGPGDYDTARSTVGPTGPAITIPPERKIKPAPLKLPGPGEYESKPFFGKEAKNYVSLASKRKVSKDKGIPGPGSYIYNPRTKVPGTYFLPKVKPKIEINPGPGQYESSYFFGKGVSYSVPKPRKRFSFPLSPGPGDYSYSTTSFKLKSPGFGKTTGRKEILKLSPVMAPGPGSYDTAKSSFARKGLSWRTSRKDNVRLGPGPGDYEIPTSTFVNRDKNKSSFFTSPGRKFSYKQTPGPGQYEVDPKKSRVKGSVKFTPRPNLHPKKLNVPGPGAYSPSVPVLPKFGGGLSHRF